MGVAGHDLGREAIGCEAAPDLFGMADVHAESDGAHLGPPPDALGDGLDGPQHERLGRSHESARELIGRVATGGPGEVAQIRAFNVQHVVAKRNQRVRNGVPDAKVADPWPWEVTLVVETIGALRRAGQSEQLFRCHPFEQIIPRARCGVVSLVKNHVVECGGIDRGAVAQRIDGRKHMALNGGPLALVQQLAEVAHLERVAKDATRLLEDLAAVRDIQQRLDASRLPQGAVIDRGHNGLPRAGRRDHQIAMPSELARGREFLKHRLLEVPRFNLDQQDFTRIVACIRRESAPAACGARRSHARNVRTDVHRPSTGRTSPASARPAPVDPTA